VRGQQPAVGPRGIGIRDDNIRPQLLAARQADPAGLAPLHQNLADLGVAAQRATLPLDQLEKPANQGPHAAHRVVHAVGALEVRDQAVVGRGGKGIAADQQRMKTEQHPQFVAVEEPADFAVDRAIAAEPKQIRGGTQQGAEVVEGLLGLPLERHAKDLAAHLEKAREALDIARLDARDLRAHLLEIGGVAKHVAVIEANFIERIQRPKGHIVFEPVAAVPPQVGKEVGRGDDGRPGVESESVALVDIGAATRRIEFFEDGDRIAAGSQAGRGRQTAEAAADDDGAVAARHERCQCNTPVCLATLRRTRRTAKNTKVATKGIDSPVSTPASTGTPDSAKPSAKYLTRPTI